MAVAVTVTPYGLKTGWEMGWRRDSVAETGTPPNRSTKVPASGLPFATWLPCLTAGGVAAGAVVPRIGVGRRSRSDTGGRDVRRARRRNVGRRRRRRPQAADPFGLGSSSRLGGSFSGLAGRHGGRGGCCGLRQVLLFPPNCGLPGRPRRCRRIQPI